MNIVYQNALAEVSTILPLLPKDLLEKIPKSLLNFIEQKRSKSYMLDVNLEKTLSEQNLLKETRIILSLLYRSYLCDPEQSRKLKIEDEIEVNKKYSYENLFKK